MRFFLALLGLIAGLAIVVAHRKLHEPSIRDLTAPGLMTMSHFIYGGIYMASFVYLHWLIRDSVLPLSELSRERKKVLMARAKEHYSKSFSAGSIQLGYFFLAFYLWEIPFGPHHGHIFLIANALFLIFLGAISQVRGLIAYLLSEQKMVSVPGPVTEFAPPQKLATTQ